ncbi:MAG: phosphoribulokinase [Candidatus Nanoarchaeia archaeon]|nr:phosphoribulokinase [Candidatus Nanoarchaeia archaeon]MDD5741340.1 phosphoribulokinase [Candidatus Nanoarchaeia archaeon]
MGKENINFKERILRSKRIFIIGVAGDSGSGKTTFVKGIRDMFGEDMVCTFSLDDYHKYDREQRDKLKITPLNPKANNLDLLYEHLVKLKKGQTINKPVYDHSTGKFGKPVKFKSKPILIIEGLMPFYTEKLRSIIDFKMFVDPERTVKRRWKIKRDVQERGHKLEDVMPEIIAREPDYKMYIDFEKIYAEVVIKIHPTKFVDITGNSDMVSIRLIQRLLDIPVSHLDLEIDLAKILKVSKRNFSLDFEGGDYYGYNVSFITIDGMVSQEVIHELEKRICEFIGGCVKDVFNEEYTTATDLAQLLIAWRFLEKINYILSHK